MLSQEDDGVCGAVAGAALPPALRLLDALGAPPDGSRAAPESPEAAALEAHRAWVEMLKAALLGVVRKVLRQVRPV